MILQTSKDIKSPKLNKTIPMYVLKNENHNHAEKIGTMMNRLKHYRIGCSFF